jgi:hypothetical protein
MDKTFTLIDLQLYLREISLIERQAPVKMLHKDGPSRLTIHNLLRYSSALNILKTDSVGTVFQLTN